MKAEKIADNSNFDADTPRNPITSVPDTTGSAHIRSLNVAGNTRSQHQPLDKAEAVRLAILRTG